MFKSLSKITLITAAITMLAGCMSISDINAKIQPVVNWYEEEYESSRFDQRYKFVEADVDRVRAAAIRALPSVGMTLVSSGGGIVARGNPATMFSREECEAWTAIDQEKTMVLSGGLLKPTCDTGSSSKQEVTAHLSFKSYDKGTLIILDYEFRAPALEGHGIKLPRRPAPAGAKAGAEKFWAALSKELLMSVNPATKEYLK